MWRVNTDFGQWFLILWALGPNAVQQPYCLPSGQPILTQFFRMSLKGRWCSVFPTPTSLQSRPFPAMLIRRPQRPSWNQPNPVVPVPTRSPPSPNRRLEQDSAGAVGFGIVAVLHKSIVASSPVKPIVSRAPVEITSPGPVSCREESRGHAHKTEKWRDEGFFCRSLPISSNKEIIVRSADFLSHCSVCRNQLHGKDVYMYQDKAFCSIDCRYQQMV